MPRKAKNPDAPKRTRKKKGEGAAAPGKVPAPWEQPEGSVPAPQMQEQQPEPITLKSGKKILTKITEWMDLQRQIAETAQLLIDRELELRKEIAGTVFTAPREGVNYCDLPDGWKLKYTNHLDRKFEQPAMSAVFAQLPQGTADFLIRWHPYLNVENFRRMQPEAVQILEQCLVTKPGTPKLELIAPPVQE